ncbi:hypothetical protein [Eleftheria terrae]|uniref:hypothetical protein n=1 Tax=Eleftheria terrae TaxID=1597781 RepID=UPI00263B32CC|nr:hypothetical protein [Eleftheria terrae]WKB55678.1 hypothetical protein N7L95_26780 [Eleftheria terrae]
MLLAVLLSSLSGQVERTGPELAAYGNVCGPRHDQLCLEPVRNAGFPIAYLFDAPGISRERNVAIVEDEFRPFAFCLNVAVYLVALLVILAAFKAAARMKRQQVGASGSTPTDDRP